MKSNLAKPIESPPVVEASLGKLWAQPATKLLALIVQLGLLLWVVYEFQIGGSLFLRIFILACAGFVVRLALPQRFQLTFFIVLSVLGAVWALGPITAAWLVAMGLLILGICHLPVAFPVRWGLMAALFGVLAVYRVEWLSAPWDRAIWPILGSMFLFRAMIYLEDLRHEGRSWSWENSLAYFFLLPNACFSLFPVVDFKTFRRSQDDGDQYWISQVGIQWMIRGIIHLVVYRFVYLYVTIAPADVSTAWDLARLVISGFALYLRVSGSFHLVVGMLHLFGFNLPETHHLYFLASGINDLWRRINIYWKDFMMKLFFYPAYFKLRRRGSATALILATVYVVVVTWFLHGVQWFWIQGWFPLRWQDGVFWTILAGLMTFGSIRELNTPKRRPTVARSRFAVNGEKFVRIAATFIGMCILWSMWTSDSLSEWLSIWSVIGRGWAAAGVARSLGPASVVVGILLMMVPTVIPETPEPVSARKAIEMAGRPAERLAFWRLASASALPLVVLLIAGFQATWTRFGPGTVDFAASLRTSRLNLIDIARLQRGYYEDLLNTDSFSTQIWELGRERPQAWGNIGHGAVRPLADYRKFEPAPFLDIILKGARFRTNGWGMRDKEYARTKPPNTYRIVAVGASYLMGPGVADGHNFESLLEDKLNREFTPITGMHYEILNFGIAGYSRIQRLMELERKAFAFQPDAVMYVAQVVDNHPSLHSDTQNIVENLEKGLAEPPYPFVQNLIAKSGITKAMSEDEAMRRMNPYGPALDRWMLQQLKQDCRERNLLLLWVELPTLGQKGVAKPDPDLPPSSPGMLTISAERVFDGMDVRRLAIAPWDFHPNATGHRMIADLLYADLIKAGGADLLRPVSLR
jgi:hypothetical protein